MVPFPAVGGLLGYNAGSISNSYVAITGSVSGPTGGGLVGNNTGSISNSYATITGSVTASGSSAIVGGLVGYNQHGSISNSYATGTGSVTGGSDSAVGGLVGYNTASIRNSYAGSVTVDSGILIGGLVGANSTAGSFSGKNYFVASAGTNGIGDGTACPDGVCIRATGADDDARRTWLQDTLDESAADTADPPGLGWSDTNWARASFTSGYPKLKYAQVDGFCSDGSDKNENACETTVGSCMGGTGNTKDACEMTAPTGTWTPTAWWLAGGDECGGSTGVRCGDVIPGQ